MEVLLKHFLVFYHQNGALRSVDLYAKSWEDAEERVRSIKYNAYIAGEVKATILSAVGWWAPAVTAIRNFFYKRSENT